MDFVPGRRRWPQRREASLGINGVRPPWLGCLKWGDVPGAAERVVPSWRPDYPAASGVARPGRRRRDRDHGTGLADRVIRGRDRRMDGPGRLRDGAPGCRIEA